MKPHLRCERSMNPITLWSFVVLGTFASAAAANCTTDPIVTGAALDTLINGKLVCGSPGPNYPGGALSADRWQEEHLVPSLQLWDYKLGANPIDPRKQVGTWLIANNQITHSYTGGSSYTWDVRQNQASRNLFSFCKGAEEHVRAVILTNRGTGCQGVFPQ